VLTARDWDALYNCNKRPWDFFGAFEKKVSTVGEIRLIDKPYQTSCPAMPRDDLGPVFENKFMKMQPRRM
jgi:hypothetical protein